MASLHAREIGEFYTECFGKKHDSNDSTFDKGCSQFSEYVELINDNENNDGARSIPTSIIIIDDDDDVDVEKESHHDIINIDNPVTINATTHSKVFDSSKDDFFS